MTVSIADDSGASALRLQYHENVGSMSRSLERLVSRVRVTGSAGDSVAVSAAARLKGEAAALGQGAKNAADMATVHTVAADAFEPALDLLETLAAKAASAAAIGVDDETRLALQSDVAGLLAEFDQTIAAARFNGHPLLTGSFLNQRFQIGTRSGETLVIGYPDSRAAAVGMLRVNQLAEAAATGALTLELTNRTTGESLSVAGIELLYNNTAANGMAALADAINAHTDSTGFTAQAIVESTSQEAVQGGVTDPDFAVNGVVIGPVVVQAADADGRLVNLINGTTDRHGISASLVDGTRLRLISSDGRGIEVTGLAPVMAAADSDMSTFGHVRIYQPGPYALQDSGDVTFASNVLTLDQDASRTMTLADIDLTTRNGALDAAAVIDAATTELTHRLEGARTAAAGANAMQKNQRLASDNAAAAGRRIMAVDLNDETTTFARMKMLTQSGAFAMVQNARWQAAPLDLVRAGDTPPVQRFFSTVDGAAATFSGSAFLKRYARNEDTPKPVVSTA